MDTSKSRQELRENIKALGTILAPAFEREPLIAASVYEQQFRCGKPTCHCAEGKKHIRMAISVNRHGINTARYVKQADADKVRKQAEAYKRVRNARAEFGKWHKEMLGLLDALEANRTESLSQFGIDNKEENK